MYTYVSTGSRKRDSQFAYHVRKTAQAPTQWHARLPLPSRKKNLKLAKTWTPWTTYFMFARVAYTCTAGFANVDMLTTVRTQFETYQHNLISGCVAKTVTRQQKNVYRFLVRRVVSVILRDAQFFQIGRIVVKLCGSVV